MSKHGNTQEQAKNFATAGITAIPVWVLSRANKVSIDQLPVDEVTRKMHFSFCEFAYLLCDELRCY